MVIIVRDINRIDGVLEELGKIWKEYPDLRLGQLLLNAVRDPALYYLEDEEIIKELKNLYKIEEQVKYLIYILQFG